MLILQIFVSNPALVIVVCETEILREELTL